MLPRTAARRVGGASRALRPVSLVRFQTTVTTAPGQENTPKSSESVSSEGSKGNPGETNTPNGTGAGTGSDGKPQRRSNYQYNRKLHDIVNQIKKSVNGIQDPNSPQLSEAIDIFEEGASYLREIQATEGIAEDALYSLFQPVSAKLFDLILAEDAQLGNRSVESVLDMMIQQRIAHTYHFIEVQRRILQNSDDPDAYPKVLQLWITFLDYSKQMSTAGAGRLVKGAFGVYRDREYQSSDILKLAYFALISHCIRTGEEYDLSTTVKILQVDDASKIPMSYHVTYTLNRLGLRESLESDVRPFVQKVTDRDVKNMDPNGVVVAKKIENLIRLNSGNGLRKLYAELKEASTRNSIAVSEQTLNRIMHAYIEVGFFDDALAIFASMCNGLIEKPSPASWELVIKALGHPSNVGRMSDSAKQSAVEKVEATFNTMLASGIKVNAKVFGVFIGSLANLDRLDLATKYMEQYKDVPIVHMTKNNILIGMAFNKKLAEAEAKMKDFLKEDPSYQPSTTVMNTFLAYYVSEGNDKAVEGILDFMNQRGIEENISTTTTLLNYYFKSYRERGMVPNVHELLSEVIKDTSKWDQFMVATLIEGLVKDGVNMEAARGVFKYFCETRRRFKHSGGMMTSMIKAELEFGSLHNAEELFDWYIKNLRNETVMYNMMIKGLLMKRESLALKYYADLRAQAPFNVLPNFYTYFFLLMHFKKKGDRSRIQWVLDEIAGANLTDFGKDLPRAIKELSGNYEVSPDLLAAFLPESRWYGGR
ncbi:hypothetical protein JCM33374_g2989 [Metschnikowia sp. JCM 33374]|nr:hypothetical protein JCM33374_g2989 [Metschnikowia sp. JCM 33374]